MYLDWKWHARLGGKRIKKVSLKSSVQNKENLQGLLTHPQSDYAEDQRLLAALFAITMNDLSLL